MSDLLDIAGLEFGADLSDVVGDLDFGADLDEMGAGDDLASQLRAALSGDDDEMGAASRSSMARQRRALARQKAQVRQAARQVVAARAAMGPRQGAGVLAGFGSVQAVRQSAPDHIRGRVLPVESASIAAGASAVINIQPQEDIRPERFIYGGASSTFTISDIRIKNRPQLSQAGNLAADIFGPAAQDTRLNFDACPVGGLIQVTVTNISGAAAVFRGAFLGSAAT